MAQVSTDYLIVTGVRAYDLNDTWYAGDNSTNNGSLGWYFETPTGGGVTVNVTGVEAVGAVGSVAIVGEANTDITGVEGVGAVGSVSAGVRIVINVTGFEAAGAVGSVNVRLGGIVPVTGLSAVGAVGSVNVRLGAIVPVTGVSAVGAVGDVTVDTIRQVLVTPESVFATGVTGEITITGDNNITVAGVVGTTALNDSLGYSLGCTVSAEGFSSTGLIGILVISTSSFNYDAVKDLYDRKRTVYVERGTTSAERTALIDGESRLVYVDSRPIRQLLVN